MFKISIRRFFQYWQSVFIKTAKDMGDYVKRILTDVIGVFFPISAYIILLTLGSNGLLKIEQINQIVAPLGELAQAILMVFLIVVTYFAASLFITPVKLYYEQKKVAEKYDWNDVHFSEVAPIEKNLLGWGIRVRNDKLTTIENFSAWLVGVQPDVIEEKRFGYVNQYETDAQSTFSGMNIDEGKEIIFIIANHSPFREGEMEIKARDSKNQFEVYIARDQKCTLDIEFRANGFPPKLIRYSLIYQTDRWPRLKRYNAEIERKWF